LKGNETHTNHYDYGGFVGEVWAKRGYSPNWQNGYIESFNARLKEECLNREELWILTEARVVFEDWRWKYNHVRPHRSLGYITPNEYAQDEVE